MGKRETIHGSEGRNRRPRSGRWWSVASCPCPETCGPPATISWPDRWPHLATEARKQKRRESEAEEWEVAEAWRRTTETKRMKSLWERRGDQPLRALRKRRNTGREKRRKWKTERDTQRLRKREKWEEDFIHTETEEALRFGSEIKIEI